MSLFELRIYEVAAGRMAELQAVFRGLVAPLLAEYDMAGIGFWATPDEARLFWIVRHDGAQGFEADWSRFHADPRWTGRSRSGPIVTGIESVALVAVPGLPPMAGSALLR